MSIFNVCWRVIVYLFIFNLKYNVVEFWNYDTSDVFLVENGIAKRIMFMVFDEAVCLYNLRSMGCGAMIMKALHCII